jgi:hypothetical protein
MVRDSTHRPCNTEELLSLAERLKVTKYDSPATIGNESKEQDAADISFFSSSTEDEEVDDSDDGDTIVQIKDKSLDEEIQSTINELPRNSLTLQEANTASDDLDKELKSLDIDEDHQSRTSSKPLESKISVSVSLNDEC